MERRKGEKELDKTAIPTTKMRILKKIIENIPMPDIEPPNFEDLEYEVSRTIYKLMVTTLYCWEADDQLAYKIFQDIKGKAGRDKRKKMIKNAFAMLIILAESDSYYRAKLRYPVLMVKSDVLLNHYFKTIRRLGFDPSIYICKRCKIPSVTEKCPKCKRKCERGKWDGHTLINIQAAVCNQERLDRLGIKTYESEGIFGQRIAELQKQGKIKIMDEEMKEKLIKEGKITEEDMIKTEDPTKDKPMKEEGR